VKKAAPKKAAPKKAAPKRAPAKKAAPKAAAPVKRITAITAKQTKTQIITALAESTGLTRKQVGDVFSSLGDLISGHMKRNGSGEFSIPETGVKIRKVRKPAAKARMGRNPATGEQIKIKARPARTVVKVSALKALKDRIG
jgi:nucleoid DNA-binding protein